MLYRFGSDYAVGSRRTSNNLSNIIGFKSLVDDLKIERGIVSSRVALLLRSAEIKPSFLVIFNKIFLIKILVVKHSPTF